MAKGIPALTSALAKNSRRGLFISSKAAMRKTLSANITFQGIGLHSGINTTVTLHPTAAGKGRYFQRIDLPDRPIIPADLTCVREAMLSTELGDRPATVRTVEHLLATLVALGVDDVLMEIDGPEVPLLDGSAQDWLTAIAGVGLIGQAFVDPKPPLIIREPITCQAGDAFVAAFPCDQTRFSYGIDFPYVPIGKQWFTWQPEQDDFATAIAPARTFGFADQVEQLRQAGLIKGGSLDNALVCDPEKWLNPPLRFTDEPVRHKLLDLLGDLSLLGKIPQAHYVAYKASHKLHTHLAQKIANSYA
jgi:UDP-3-O-[3-hydroxymyristoyl] N-acetylglucosamine deacetylase